MLSEPPKDAVGGETYVQKAGGEILKLQFPAAGYAYLLQGSILPKALLFGLHPQTPVPCSHSGFLLHGIFDHYPEVFAHLLQR